MLQGGKYIVTMIDTIQKSKIFFTWGSTPSSVGSDLVFPQDIKKLKKKKKRKKWQHRPPTPAASYAPAKTPRNPAPAHNA